MSIFSLLNTATTVNMIFANWINDNDLTYVYV